MQHMGNKHSYAFFFFFFFFFMFFEELKEI